MLLHRALFAGAVSVTPALDVVNGGWRVATAKVFSSTATGYKIYMKAGTPASTSDYDEVKDIQSGGQQSILFDTPVEGEIYYFVAVALQGAETSLPSVIRFFTENEIVLFSKSTSGSFSFVVPQDMFVLNCHLVGGAGGPGGGGGGGSNDFVNGSPGGGGSGGTAGTNTIFDSYIASGGSGGGGGGGAGGPGFTGFINGITGTDGIASTSHVGGSGGAGQTISVLPQVGGNGSLDTGGSWSEEPNWGKRNTFVPAGGAGRNSGIAGASGGLGGSGYYLNVPNMEVIPGAHIVGSVGNRGAGGAGGIGGSIFGQTAGNGQMATGSNLGNPGGIKIKG
ncbi:hypothetical protein ACQV5M_11300 [Leptospira sp. SA-E8]|uniref:hypothetical protein n=1 Tax=Leptospira sp. SA-E8 TaxID=3422259 RepID=UPI003EB92FCF